MKKLGLTLLGIFALSQVYATCSACQACTGTYYVCDSSASQFDQHLQTNCGPGTSVEIQYLEGC